MSIRVNGECNMRVNGECHMRVNGGCHMRVNGGCYMRVNGGAMVACLCLSFKCSLWNKMSGLFQESAI